ncbi:MAG: hypothetical protein HZA08_13215 [Nitrospirae bacterium]|nr:hypothetical protein [Nitrospirota bacterium]
MNIEKIFDSIDLIGRKIADVYQCFLENFYDNPEYREFWEDLIQSEAAHLELLNRFRSIVSSSSHPACEVLGKEVEYPALISLIAKYEEEITDGVDINLALKIAFHLEVLEIQGIFNELIKMPHEPYFEILSQIHLEIRKNMGRLIEGIEHFSTDPDFLKKVTELKGGIIERRSGSDRREGEDKYKGHERRGNDRRQGKIVKIVCKI